MTTAQQHELDATDTAIITALAAGETRAEAATRAGVSPSTVNRRLARPAVRAALSDRRRAALSVPLSNAMRLLPLGLNRLERVLSDENAPLSAVIRAAETVASIAARLSAPAAELETRHLVDAHHADREQQVADRKAEKAERRSDPQPDRLPPRMEAVAQTITEAVRDYFTLFGSVAEAEQRDERANLEASIARLLGMAFTSPSAAPMEAN